MNYNEVVIRHIPGLQGCWSDRLHNIMVPVYEYLSIAKPRLTLTHPRNIHRIIIATIILSLQHSYTKYRTTWQYSNLMYALSKYTSCILLIYGFSQLPTKQCTYVQYRHHSTYHLALRNPNAYTFCIWAICTYRVTKFVSILHYKWQHTDILHLFVFYCVPIAWCYTTHQEKC